MIKIPVRVNESMRVDLEKYIFNSGLYKYRVKFNGLASKIIIDWLENPILDSNKMTYGKAEDPRTDKFTIFLSEEQYTKFREIYSKKYSEECRSPSILIYNIIKQFIEEKELD